MRDRLEILQRLAGYVNLAEFARQAGVNDATMRQHIARESVPYAKACQYAETVARRGVAVTPEWIMHGRGPAPIAGRYAETHTTETTQSGNVSAGGREAFDFRPSLGSAQLTIKFFDASEMPRGYMSIALVSRDVPGRPEWSTNPDDFTLFVHTDVMAPAIERGDRIFVNSVAAVMTGDLVILMQDGTDDGRIVAVRRLLSVTDNHYRCEQINPRRAENFGRSVWKTIHKVQGIRKP